MPNPADGIVVQGAFFSQSSRGLTRAKGVFVVLSGFFRFLWKRAYASFFRSETERYSRWSYRSVSPYGLDNQFIDYIYKGRYL
jgi:hypothetical protein